MSKPHPDWNLNSLLITVGGALITLLCGILIALLAWEGQRIVNRQDSAAVLLAAHDTHLASIDTHLVTVDAKQDIQRKRLDKMLTQDEFKNVMHSLALRVGDFDGFYTNGPHPP